MQTTDLGSLIQLLNTPGGDGMLPMLAQRENMVMDQSKATLEDTIARTGIAKDSNARENQLQPLKMAGMQGDNEARILQNEDLRFKGKVRDTLGPEFYVDQEKNKAAAEDAKKLKAGYESFAGIAGSLQGADNSAPGQRRAMVVEQLKRLGMTSLIPKAESIPEEHLATTFTQMAEHAAKLSRQYLMADRNADAKEAVGAGNNAATISAAEIRRKAVVEAANIRANAKARSGGDPKALKENMEQMYTRLRRAEMAATDPNERAVLAATAAQIYEDMQNKPPTAGAQATGIVTKPDGTLGLGKEPKNVPRSTSPLPVPPKAAPAPDNSGLGKTREAPAKISAQADYDKLPKGSFYINPNDGKTYQKK